MSIEENRSIFEENQIDEEENIHLSDQDIFSKIWLSPKMIFQYLDRIKYDKYLYPLMILIGISSSFDNSISRGLGDSWPLWGILALSILGGGILGWISYYILAALLSWTGKWLDGKGDTDSIYRMMSYAFLPSIFSLVLLIAQILLFGSGIFESNFDASDYGLIFFLFYFLFSSLEFILGIWTLVLFIIGLSVIQELSIWKSILNLLLPILIIFIPIATIAFILGDLFK